MLGNIIERLKEVETFPFTLSRSEFGLSASSAGQRERIASYQFDRPTKLRDDKAVNIAILAYEEIGSDGTAGNQGTVNLSHNLVETGATDQTVTVFEGGTQLPVDAVDFANDSVTVTPQNANSTLGIFYAAGEQARVTVRKRDPSDNDETLFSADVSLLHARNHGKEPVYLDFENPSQPIIPPDWNLDVYVRAPYRAALAFDVDGDGEKEIAPNGLLSFPAERTTETIDGLDRAVKFARGER